MRFLAGRLTRSRPEAPPGTARVRSLGRAGESAAARFLEGRGYQVVGRGFRAARGELDLVCRHGDRLVVVEVKTRSSDRNGSPAEAVGPRKRRSLEAAAADYRLLSGWRGPVEFAVVAVTVSGDRYNLELIDDPV